MDMKEDVTQVKSPVCNASTVTNENERRDPLLLKDKDGYKVRKRQHQLVHTIVSFCNTLQRNPSLT